MKPSCIGCALIIAAVFPAHGKAAPSTVDEVLNKHATVAALDRLRRSAPSLRVHWPVERARPTMLRGLRVVVPGTSLEQRARRFIERHFRLLVPSRSELRLIDRRSTTTRSVLRFAQTHHGIPVYGRIVTVAFDPDQRIRAVHAETTDVQLPRSEPTVAARTAVQVVQRRLGLAATRDGAVAQQGLTILADGPARLAYGIMLPFASDPRGRLHLVDAQSGDYIGWRPGVIWERQKQVQR